MKETLKATPYDMTKHAIALVGVRNVAQELGITTQAVHQWKRIPAEHVIVIETMCNGLVSRHELRPDIFGEQA